MSGRRTDVLDVRELIRQSRLGESSRQIARNLNTSRDTVGKYRRWAEENDLLSGPLPAIEELERRLVQAFNPSPPPKAASTVEPFRSFVQDQRRQSVEIQAIYQRLQTQGFLGSYSAVRRFVNNLEPHQPEAVARIEVSPGAEVQVDFGYGGRLVDPATGEIRKAWFGVFTLSWSRHQYVEFVWDQTVATWLLLHQHAFEFFGGVPRRVVVDNLKAAIIRACWDDPAVQRSYRQCAEHYGFLIAPCRPGMPEHKGKVESGVHYAQRNFLSGRELCSITVTNQDVLIWVMGRAGHRRHGTTKEQPLDRFERVEKAVLLPLPSEPYDPVVWKRVTLPRDCYVVFDDAYYSAPHRLIGKELWVCGGLQAVRIYADHLLVATHRRAQSPGERTTHPDHLSPRKAAAVILTRERCWEQAKTTGEATLQVVSHLLGDHPVDRLPVAQALLFLGDRFGYDRLERACARSVHFDDYTYRTVRRILVQGLEAVEVLAPVTPETSTAPCFARSAKELLGGLQGGAKWN